VADPNLLNSSQVAAGMFNPITGNRMNKTWLADQIFPFLHQFYRQLEKLLKVCFLYPRPIYRPFDSIEKQNFWISQSTDMTDFVNHNFPKEKYNSLINNDFGGIEILQGGNIDTEILLKNYQKFLRENNFFIETEILEKDLIFEKNKVFWKDIEAEKIIFCRGFREKDSNLFSFLPFQCAKGEILTVHLPNLKLDSILNKNMWILPIGNDLYKMGSTYEWEELNFEITPQARQHILEETNKMLKIYATEVVFQQAGVRPATKDRRPFLGFHKEFSQVGIFNGLGTKGISLAPFMAKSFANSLVSDQKLDSLIDIQRFLGKYNWF
jgi:glycine/D-amino acid oxidase-like deaminating enzyme